MTEEQLQAIKMRAKYATDGPWKVVKSEESGVQIGTTWEHGQLKVGVPIVTTAHGKGGVTVYINHVNAEFIANAREDIPALIAEVERLRDVLEEYAAKENYEREANDPDIYEGGYSRPTWEPSWIELDNGETARKALEVEINE